MLLDANILIYAVDASSPHHQPVREWFEGALSGSMQVGLASPVILAFLRITTNARAMRKPLSANQALAYMDEWLAWPSIVRLLPGERHWSIFKELLAQAGAAGNLTTDAWLAALAIEQGYAMATTDNDFRRFAGLRCVNPLMVA